MLRKLTLRMENENIRVVDAISHALRQSMERRDI
jgi:hypothetical protein